MKSEARIQAEIVRWYRNTYCLAHHNPRCMIFSIPNEGRGPAATQLIATGLYPGIADLMVIHDTGIGCGECGGSPKVLFIECKTLIGTQSPNQKRFESHCKAMGIEYKIIRHLEDFRRIIENL